MQNVMREESSVCPHSRVAAGLAGKGPALAGALEAWVTQAGVGSGGREGSRWRGAHRAQVQRREGGYEPQQRAFLAGPRSERGQGDRRHDGHAVPGKTLRPNASPGQGSTNTKWRAAGPSLLTQDAGKGFWEIKVTTGGSRGRCLHVWVISI